MKSKPSPRLPSPKRDQKERFERSTRREETDRLERNIRSAKRKHHAPKGQNPPKVPLSPTRSRFSPIQDPTGLASPRKHQSPKFQRKRQSPTEALLSPKRGDFASNRVHSSIPPPPDLASPIRLPSPRITSPRKNSSPPRGDSPKREQPSSRRQTPKKDHQSPTHSQNSKKKLYAYPRQFLSPRRDQFAPNDPDLSSKRPPDLTSPTQRNNGSQRHDSATRSPKVFTRRDEASEIQPLPISTYDTKVPDLTTSHKSDYVVESPVQPEKQRVDEAFLAYTYAEKAALQIQKNFRKKKFQQSLDKDVDTDTDDHTEDKLKGDAEDKEDGEEGSRMWTLLFLTCGAAFMMLGHCFSCATKLFGGNSDVDAPVPIEGAAPPPGQGGGGGGGAAPPPGLEAMAGNAAGAASGAASSGVAAGATAGAAAASASAAAAGAAAGAAGAQVVTAVAVSSAVVATAATAGLVATNLGNTTDTLLPPITTICGLVEPDVRKGQFTMIFEGFSRPFDDREKMIVENLVVEAYNNLTIGADLESVGCLDPLSREMAEAKLVNQTWDPIAEGSDPLLETVFQTTLQCDKCSVFQPLFSPEKEDDERRLFEHRGLEQDGAVDGTDLISSALFDFTSREFFQRLLQLVIFRTEDLTEIGELPDGFIQMTRAFVTPVPPESDGLGSGSSANVIDTETDTEAPPNLEDYLVTEIAYQPQGPGGEKGAFRFMYVNEETGEEQIEIVVVDSNTILEDPLVEPVPTTSFPTFGPTKSPTISPSTVPTITFSGQPTREPSGKPSMAPTNTPSAFPSERPSVVPSLPPSNVPSVVPTEPPSLIPSFSPSEAPTFTPTIRQSIGPTLSPSISPSVMPSYVPSDVPSEDPSVSPSVIPSTMPSVSPSMIPSTMPSVSPSMIPSTVPSDSPSMNPSIIPSMAPSMVPSVSPSSSPTTLPSTSPSSAPTKVPSVEPSSTPSFQPSIATFHFVACGGTGGCPGTVLFNSNSVVDNGGGAIAVRCCSDTAISGWTQAAGCPYADTEIGGSCYASTNWYDATARCASVGARLCTSTELNNQCTTGTGCNYNLNSVWSSTAGTPP